MPYFDKKILFLFGGRGIQALLAIATIRLMTELISPQEIGNQYVINSMIMWFSLVLVNPMGMYINRHLNEWKQRHELAFYLKRINRYFLMIAVLSLPIVLLARYFFDVGQGLPKAELMAFIIVYIYLSTWFQTLVSFFNLFEFQKIFVALSILSQLVGLIAAFTYTHFFRADAIGWLSGLLTGQVIALACAVYFLRTRILERHQTSIVNPAGLFNKATLLFCFPVAITTIFMWFLNQGYRLVINKNLGAEALASVGIGLGLAASLASVVESITTQYLYPKYYASLPQSDFEGRKAAWFVLWKRTVGIYIVCAFFILSVAQIVVRFLTAKQYQNVISFMLFGIFIEFLRQNSNIIYLSAHGEKKTQKTILPYMSGALFAAASFAILIINQAFTIESLLWSLAASHLVTYIFNLIQVKKDLQVQFDLSVIKRSFLLAIPFIGLYALTVGRENLWVLIGCAILSLGWCLLGLYFLNRDQKINRTAS